MNISIGNMCIRCWNLLLWPEMRLSFPGPSPSWLFTSRIFLNFFFSVQKPVRAVEFQSLRLQVWYHTWRLGMTSVGEQQGTGLCLSRTWVVSYLSRASIWNKFLWYLNQSTQVWRITCKASINNIQQCIPRNLRFRLKPVCSQITLAKFECGYLKPTWTRDSRTHETPMPGDGSFYRVYGRRKPW